MEKQYKTTNGFTNATNLKLFVAYRIAIIKSQDLGKTKNEKRLKTIGNKIKELRRSKGMSQKDIADKLGVTSQAVSKWENEVSLR